MGYSFSQPLPWPQPKAPLPSLIRKLKTVKCQMKIGTTTFGFRYSLMDAANSPKLSQVIRLAREAGVERLQVCENARPLELSKADWAEARRCAADLGVELQLGCKTLQEEVVADYLVLAQELACDHLRIVLEDPPAHATGERVARLLEGIVPKMRKASIRLAIENHFDIPSAKLLELASVYPPNEVGFCVDTANSLRSLESPGEVINLLRERAYCYHLKDYRIVGSLISFSVVGAPLGEGNLDLDLCLSLILEHDPVPPLFVELWAPTENNRDQDVLLEADWLRRSVRNLQSRLKERERPQT